MVPKVWRALPFSTAFTISKHYHPFCLGGHSLSLTGLSVLAGNLPRASDAVLAHIYQYGPYSGDFEPTNDPFFPVGSQPAYDYTLPVSTK